MVCGTYGGGEEEVGEVDGALARVGVQASHWRLAEEVQVEVEVEVQVEVQG